MTQQTPTLGVAFYVKKYKAMKGTVPLYLRISVNGKNADTSLKRRIPEAMWRAKDDKIKGATPEIKQLNLYLEKVKVKIHHFYDEMVLHQKPVSAQILKEKFLGQDRSAPTLLQLLKYHHDIIAILKGKNDFTLVLMKSKDGAPAYPEAFHIGFLQESKDAVFDLHNKLKSGSINLGKEPGKIRGGFGFYFVFDNIMIEVSSAENK